MNNWLTFFTEITHLLCACFLDADYRQGGKAETESFRKIAEALSGVERRSGTCGWLLIRSLGLGEKTTKARGDGYELVLRNIAMDISVTPMMIRGAGSKMSSFSEKLTQVFDVFSQNNITSVKLKVPWRIPEDLDRLKESLRILSGFFQAVNTDSPVMYAKNGKQISIPVIRDENGRPHPNLTLMTGLNDLDSAKAQEVIKKIDAMVREEEAKTSGNLFIDVYDAMQCSPKFQQLMKPPVEVNNTRWLLTSGDTDTISNEKIQVAREAAQFFDNSAHQVAQLITGIYGNDYGTINARVLGERLILITHFLDRIGKKAGAEGITKDVCESILNRFTQVQRAVRNNLVVKGDTLHVISKGIEIPMGVIHHEFVKMIRFFGSAPLPEEEQSARKTVGEKDIQEPDAPLLQEADTSGGESRDMEKMVEERFDQIESAVAMHAEKTEPPPIPVDAGTKKSAVPDTGESEDAEDMVTPFKRCFDSRGHFQKGSFEQNIPALARHREQIFEFIWQYLKKTMNRGDRLALLSALYLLVNKINQSEKAVSVLLNDIFREPNKVDISDRNGLMLANLVIRKYNKEFNKEIELTPEEVFMVKEGLIGSAVEKASGIIEKNQKKVMQKQMTVYKGLAESVNLDMPTDASMLSFRYLLNLEREACIFLSLVGGPTPRAVLRNAVKNYGDPESGLYRANGENGHITAFLQHLKVLVRGLGRIGDKDDLPVLEELKKKEQGFMRFGHDQRHQDIIQRVMIWADEAAKNLEENSGR